MHVMLLMLCRDQQDVWFLTAQSDVIQLFSGWDVLPALAMQVAVQCRSGVYREESSKGLALWR